ncbi:MAG TPA: carbamate kinase [Candidatus Dormibacteraeota bacterium]|nr:carbamate kinase [Candidatus Dormibacteraeota bacterium]
MRIVAALGGNALLRRGEPLEASIQRERVQAAAHALAPLARRHELVVTHGNGPQVGLLALQSEAYTAVHPYPLDVLVAESEGMIGYLLEQALQNEIPEREVVTVLTEVVVDNDDPAFARPTKPVGPVYAESTARALASERGWSVASDGSGYRRVVASPEPGEIVQADTIKRLVETGAIVICSGGGGIPTVLDCRSGRRVGAEAVIDKDLSAALLAQEVGADFLLLLTDVEFVQDGWGTGDAHAIAGATPAQLRGMRFAAGSMAPKVEAACRFVEATGKAAAIGSLLKADEVIAGTSGTHVSESVLIKESVR